MLNELLGETRRDVTRKEIVHFIAENYTTWDILTNVVCTDMCWIIATIAKNKIDQQARYNYQKPVNRNYLNSKSIKFSFYRLKSVLAAYYCNWQRYYKWRLLEMCCLPVVSKCEYWPVSVFISLRLSCCVI